MTVAPPFPAEVTMTPAAARLHDASIVLSPGAATDTARAHPDSTAARPRGWKATARAEALG